MGTSWWTDPQDPEPRALLALARDPETPSDELLRVHRHPTVAKIRFDAKTDPYVYTDYPGHHLDPPARREAYLSDLDSALAEHPHAPLELQADLARAGYGVSLTFNPNVEPSILEGLVAGTYGEQPALQDRFLLANPVTPGGILEWIARRAGRPEDLEAVLRHPHVTAAARAAAEFKLGRAEASEATLRELVRAGQRYRVARYAGTPATILADLVASGGLQRHELAAVAENPNATPAVLHAVAEGIARRVPGAWSDGWLDSPDPERNPIAGLRAHPAADAEVLAPLAAVIRLFDIHPRERSRLAADPQTDPAMLTTLADDYVEATLTALATNPATPAVALDALAPANGRNVAEHVRAELGRLLVEHPSAPPGLLRRLYEYAAQTNRFSYLAPLFRHPRTPPEIRARSSPCHLLLVGPAPADALAVAPDGAWLASRALNVRVWDPADGTVRRTLRSHAGAHELLTAPDGSWLATGGYGSTIQIWNLRDEAEPHELIGHPRGVKTLAVAPDGSWLAGGGIGKEVRIWDPGSGTIRHILTGHTQEVTALVVAPDGSWLASGGLGKSVRIWDPDTGTIRQLLTSDVRQGRTLAAAPDGSWLAGAESGGPVRIWDLAAGETRHVLTGHDKLVCALVVAPDGSFLATAGLDGTARIWDPRTGRSLHTLTDHTAPCWRWPWPRTAAGSPAPPGTTRCGSGTCAPADPGPARSRPPDGERDPASLDAEEDHLRPPAHRLEQRQRHRRRRSGLDCRLGMGDTRCAVARRRLLGDLADRLRARSRSAERRAAQVPAWRTAPALGITAFAKANARIWAEFDGGEPDDWTRRLVDASLQLCAGRGNG